MRNYKQAELPETLTQVLEYGGEALEEFGEAYGSAIAQRVGRCFKDRSYANPLKNPTELPCELVLVHSCYRYFMLLQRAGAGLDGVFTEEEFQLIFNVGHGYHPLCDLNPSSTMQNMAELVAYNYGIEDLNDSRGPMRALLKKLVKLSPLEDVALMDACEQVLRGHPNPLLDFCNFGQMC